MMKRLFVMLVVFMLIVAAGLGYYVSRPIPLHAVPFEFSLKQGSSLKSVARDMRQAGLLDMEWPFVWVARMLGKSAQLKAGNYEFDRPISILDLLEAMTKGSVSQSQVSIIEGWTFKQFRAMLDANPDIRHDTKGLSDAEIMLRIGATESHPEGLFFPDTYYVAVGSSDLAVFGRAYRTMQQRLQEAWAARAADTPIQTPYQALTLASIVEKETGIASDRPLIAGVFVNRLRKGMLLQTDPTVIYGLGDRFDGNLRRRDLLTDTTYNTYTRPGLTPTPIALPGAAALQAALHPAKTDALYFVARGDGSSQFSSNLEAHNRAVNRYQK